MKPTLDQAEFLFKRFPEKTLREWAEDWEMSHENVRLMKIKLGLPTSKKVAYDSEIARQIVEFIEQYVDYEKIFKGELQNKLEAFYGALKWGGLPQKNAKLINKFFEF